MHRLASATHSSGESFQYRYDAVGNRLIYTRTLASQSVTTYTYDAANRLLDVGGVPHTWDANGNLLSDGNKTYAYDQANRLVNITGSGLAWSVTYNGDGARLRQIVNGVPTTLRLRSGQATRWIWPRRWCRYWCSKTAMELRATCMA